MKNRSLTIQLFTCAAVLMMSSCKDTVNNVVDPDYSDLSNKYKTYVTAKTIVPTVGNMSEPQVKAMVGKKVYVSAFRTSNYANSASADFVSSALLRNQLALFDSDGKLTFMSNNQPVEKKYPKTAQDSRYQFFAYALDGAKKLGDVQSTTSLMTQEIELNGTQDVLAGYAYHTDEQLSRAVYQSVKATPSFNGTDALRAVNEYGNELAYSSLLGYLNVHPKFQFRPITSEHVIKLQGKVADNGTSYFSNVLITKIYVKSPASGTLVLADHSWTEDFDSLDIDRLFKLNTSAERKELTAIINDQNSLSTMTTAMKAKRQAMIDAANKELKKAGKTLPKNVWHCNSTSLRTVVASGSFYLPYVKSNDVKLYVEGYFLSGTYDSKNQVFNLRTDVENPVQLISAACDFMPAIEESVRVQDYFLPGAKYEDQIEMTIEVASQTMQAEMNINQKIKSIRLR